MTNQNGIVHTINENCVCCHKCISACPVKYSNFEEDGVVKVNDKICIACGACIDACTHGARVYDDDTQKAIADLEGKVPIVALVAPSVAVNLPNTYHNLIGWLRAKGVDAVFDVSFGAELTVKSYLNYIIKEKPPVVVAQPCPSIVKYIQIYRPELLPFLAPLHSPIIHSIIMIKNYYKQYTNHNIMVITPCIAKKAEFESTGFGDYNVTIAKLKQYFDDNNINLNNYEASGFDGPVAERAVNFSTPGGLLETAARASKDIYQKARKIEGTNEIYHYLDKLTQAISEGYAPKLIDCLNCSMGCNGGTGTEKTDKGIDELEYWANKRKQEQIEYYQQNKPGPEEKAIIEEEIEKYWKEDLYKRTYTKETVVFSEMFIEPNQDELAAIIKTLHGEIENAEKNCPSCGYNSCNAMAKAIHNNLNTAENCHFHMSGQIKELNESLSEKVSKQTKQLEGQRDDIVKQSTELLNFINRLRSLIQE